MTQTARAFGSVNEALTFFVNYYVSLAEFKAVLDRLTSFDASIDGAHARRAASLGSRAGARDDKMALDAVDRAAAGRAGYRQSGNLCASRRDESTLLTRAVRLGQIDPVPRHLRHLALWRGPVIYAARRQA